MRGGSSSRIASGALRIGVFVVVAKLCVAAREVVNAYYFGVSQTIDAYNVALTAVTWVPLLLVAAFRAVLVPKLIQLRAGDGHGAFLAELNGLTWLGGFLILILSLIAGPFASRFISSGLTVGARNEAALMTNQMAIFGMLTLLTGYYSTLLQTNERFFYSALEALPALSASLFVAFAATNMGESSLSVGTVVGGTVQLAWLMHMVARTPDGLGRVRVTFRSAEWRSVWAGMGAMTIAQALLFGLAPVEQYFLSRMGEGAIASVGYANRFVGLGTSVGTVILGRALLPVISDLIAAGEYAHALATVRKWVAIAFGVGLVAAAVGCALSVHVVRLLLQRGAFTESDTQTVGRLVALGLLQLPFFFAGIAAVQWLAAAGRFRTIFLIAAATLALKLLLLALWIPLYGATGAMASTVAMYALACVLQIASLRKSLR
jgi:peptidoglycan biosynthesis protein MviN/MurJ (putative lipid II flippase)